MAGGAIDWLLGRTSIDPFQKRRKRDIELPSEEKPTSKLDQIRAGYKKFQELGSKKPRR